MKWVNDKSFATRQIWVDGSADIIGDGTEGRPLTYNQLKNYFNPDIGSPCPLAAMAGDLINIKNTINLSDDVVFSIKVVIDGYIYICAWDIVQFGAWKINADNSPDSTVILFENEADYYISNIQIRDFILCKNTGDEADIKVTNFTGDSGHPVTLDVSNFIISSLDEIHLGAQQYITINYYGYSLICEECSLEGLGDLNLKGGTIKATSLIDATIPPPEADFSYAQEDGTLEVTYTDESSGNPTIYAWDFGIGATPATASTAGPHVVTYDAEGDRSVSLTVTNTGGTDSVIKPVTVNPKDVPILWWKGENNAVESMAGLPTTWGITPAYAVGKVGQAFDINYTPSDYVNILSTPNHVKFNFGATDKFSVRMWIYISSVGMQNLVLVGKGVHPYLSHLFDWLLLLSLTDSSIKIFPGGVGAFISTSTISFLDAAWNEIIWSYDSGTHKVYLNNIDVSNSSWVGHTYNIANNPLDLSMGVIYPDGYGTFHNWTGKLDEIRFYGKIIVPESAPVSDFKWRRNGSGSGYSNGIVNFYGVPFILDFEDASSNDPTSWSYQVKNNDTEEYTEIATTQNPSVINLWALGSDYYTHEDEYFHYNLRLIATNGIGSDTKDRELKCYIYPM